MGEIRSGGGTAPVKGAAIPEQSCMKEARREGTWLFPLLHRSLVLPSEMFGMVYVVYVPCPAATSIRS